MNGRNAMGVFDADMGARTLAWRIREKRPFFFVRIGDGAIECLLGRGRATHTCDKEMYTPALAKRLASAIIALKGAGDTVLWGDWRTAVAGSEPTYVPQWVALVNPEVRVRVDYESLLLMRDSAALVEFYQAARDDRRKKLYIGRDAIEACHLLKCAKGITTPMGLVADSGWLLETIECARPEVIYFGAGMAGLVSVVEYWDAHRGVTCVHLGSALDPLYREKPTRARQLSCRQASALMERLT